MSKPINQLGVGMPCGVCGEDIEDGSECDCEGTEFCTCEFYHHHVGCCDTEEYRHEHA